MSCQKFVRYLTPYFFLHALLSLSDFPKPLFTLYVPEIETIFFLSLRKVSKTLPYIETSILLFRHSTASVEIKLQPKPDILIALYVYIDRVNNPTLD